MNAAVVAQRSTVEVLLDQFANDLAEAKPEWCALVTMSFWIGQAQDMIARLRQLGPAGDAAIAQVDVLLRHACNHRYGGAWRSG